MALPLAQHCLLDSITDDQITLLLDESGVSLQGNSAEAQLEKALASYLGRALKLRIQTTQLQEETPEKRQVRRVAEKQAAAEEAIRNDSFVRQLQETFGATIVPGSIHPRTETGKV